jgi:hypothetical protein
MSGVKGYTGSSPPTMAGRRSKTRAATQRAAGRRRRAPNARWWPIACRRRHVPAQRPVRQRASSSAEAAMAVMLRGAVEVEVSEGTRRRFGPGDLVLAADTTGRGHLTFCRRRSANRSTLRPRSVITPIATASRFMSARRPATATVSPERRGARGVANCTAGQSDVGGRGCSRLRSGQAERAKLSRRSMYQAGKPRRRAGSTMRWT